MSRILPGIPDIRVSQMESTLPICRTKGAHMIRHMAGLAEVVEDVDAAVAFYRGLGLTVNQDGPDYAVAEVPGTLHFGIWSRPSAAESTYGSRHAGDPGPLGVVLGPA